MARWAFAPIIFTSYYILALEVAKIRYKYQYLCRTNLRSAFFSNRAGSEFLNFSKKTVMTNSEAIQIAS